MPTYCGAQDGHGEEEGGGEEHSQVDQQGAHHVVHGVNLKREDLTRLFSPFLVRLVGSNLHRSNL
jgi:hypothetical protein